MRRSSGMIKTVSQMLIQSRKMEASRTFRPSKEEEHPYSNSHGMQERDDHDDNVYRFQLHPLTFAPLRRSSFRHFAGRLRLEFQRQSLNSETRTADSCSYEVNPSCKIESACNLQRVGEEVSFCIKLNICRVCNHFIKQYF